MRRYDLLRNDGAIWLDGPIDTDGISVAAMRRSLREIADQDTVSLMVDSPGGCSREGLAMYVALHSCRQPVCVTVVGLAGSAAALVAMAGTEIAIVEHGQFFLHGSMAATDRRTINGKPYLYAWELKARAAQCDRDDAVFRDIVSGRTGLSADYVKRLCDDETTLNAPEAVSLGFADYTITADEIAGRRAMRAVANVNDEPSICDVA